MVKGFRDDTVDFLKKYAWPGNVRELENLVEQLMITADHEWILPEDLPIHIYSNSAFSQNKDDFGQSMASDDLFNDKMEIKIDGFDDKK